MTNKTQKNERRILVVDDERGTRAVFKYISNLFHAPESPCKKDEYLPKYYKFYSEGLGRELKISRTCFKLELVEDALRNNQYRAILLDGELREDSEDGLTRNSKKNGIDIAINLQGGFYGPLNQKVPIYNISTSYQIPGCTKKLYKPYGRLEQCFSKWGIDLVKKIIFELDGDLK